MSTPAVAATHEIRVSVGSRFVPKNLVINEGDTVRWVWESVGHTPHNIQSGVNGSSNGIFASAGTHNLGETFKVKFSKKFLRDNPVAGNRYRYFCPPHWGEGMIGSIKIRESSITGKKINLPK